eukprot:RCo002602
MTSRRASVPAMEPQASSSQSPSTASARRKSAAVSRSTLLQQVNEFHELHGAQDLSFGARLVITLVRVENAPPDPGGLQALFQAGTCNAASGISWKPDDPRLAVHHWDQDIFLTIVDPTKTSEVDVLLIRVPPGHTSPKTGGGVPMPGGTTPDLGPPREMCTPAGTSAVGRVSLPLAGLQAGVPKEFRVALVAEEGGSGGGAIEEERSGSFSLSRKSSKSARRASTSQAAPLALGGAGWLLVQL